MEGISRVRNWLAQNGYDGVILTRRDNYTWITGGDKNHVLTSTETGVASLLVTADTLSLYADSSDALRMKEEDNRLGAELVLVPWYENMEAVLRQAVAGGRFVSDTGIASAENVQPQLIQLRLQLTGKEVERYRRLGREGAGIVEQTCREAEPGQTEQQISNRLKARCQDAGISPDCVLVGSDEAILRYRHPIPSDKPIRNSLMVVLGGEKYGLNISLTRMVYFTKVPAEIEHKYEAVQQIFAAMQGMMKDSMPYQEYFRKVQKLYADAGYGEEWKLHHQGGPTGYGCREQVIKPDMQGQLQYHQAYAWNPTITGVKCEDTTYLDESGTEVLTQTDEWPRTAVETEFGVCLAVEILKR